MSEKPSAKEVPSGSGGSVMWGQQSPIDLGKSLYAPGLPKITFQYDAEVTGRMNGHNFDLDPGSNAWLTIHEPTQLVYPLIRIHFHAPAEHSINYQENAFEAHLVHQGLGIADTFTSTLVVVGIFFTVPTTKSEKRRPMADVIQSLGFKGTEGGLHSLTPNVLLPSDRSNYYRYEGSLTTPPYSENVSWYVMKGTNPLDSDIERKVKDETEEEARPLQPLARRFVLRNFS